VLPHVRCDAQLTRRVDPNGCQLYVGHDGDHAIVFASGEARILRRWTETGSVTDRPFDSEVAAKFSWSPGCPTVPADELQPGAAAGGRKTE
jgi:hypothetical protein